MTAQEYIDKFHMDGDQKKFSHPEFLRAFAQEFDTEVSKVSTYEEFNKVVSSMMEKFKEIRSIRTKHKNLSDKLWKAFFAIYVVPKRKSLYPEEQERIDQKRKSHVNNKYAR